jgi:hypothetical protein
MSQNPEEPACCLAPPVHWVHAGSGTRKGPGCPFAAGKLLSGALAWVSMALVNRRQLEPLSVCSGHGSCCMPLLTDSTFRSSAD